MHRNTHLVRPPMRAVARGLAIAVEYVLEWNPGEQHVDDIADALALDADERPRLRVVLERLVASARIVRGTRAEHDSYAARPRKPVRAPYRYGRPEGWGVPDDAPRS